MITTRLLECSVRDQEFFGLAEGWRREYPTWLRESNGELETLMEMATDPQALHFGVWDDQGPMALIIYQHMGNGWWETHLESRRGVKAEDVASTIWLWGWHVFLNLKAEVIYAWVPEVNRVSTKLCNSLHLFYDGTVRWQKVYKGRVLIWRRLSFFRHEWLELYEQVKNDVIQTENPAGYESGSGLRVEGNDQGHSHWIC